MMLSTYKKAILGAIFGALLTAVLSLAIGLYSLNKSFELTQKKDLLYSLRSDITLLKNVERELDENLNLLLNRDYRIVFEAQQVSMPEFPIENKEDKEFMKQLMEYLKQIGGDFYKVTKIELPPDKLVADAWQPSGPPVSDIEFELIQRLNDFYRKLSRANDFLKNMGAISQDMLLPKASVNSINYSVPQYNNVIGEITQKKILKLKNEIASEVNRLQKERTKIRM